MMQAGGQVKLSKGASGAITAKEIYFTPKMKNHHGGMIVVDDCLYGAAGGNRGGFLVCFDFRTGADLWSERRAPKGSLTLADGRLYLRAEEGTLLLIEPNREKYVERGRFEQPDRSKEPAWTHPGRCQRQAVRARPGFASLLRREGEVRKVSALEAENLCIQEC
jgi:hypothetical protein